MSAELTSRALSGRSIFRNGVAAVGRMELRVHLQIGSISRDTPLLMAPKVPFSFLCRISSTADGLTATLAHATVARG
eukprot:COSAG02_NODE_25356_length_661_cov_0.709964_1_plen_76_part_10